MFPHHYPYCSPHSKFLFSSPSSCSPVICPCPPSLPPYDPSLPSCQSLLFLAAQWPGQTGAPGLQAACVMTGNARLHTLSSNMWRSACHTCLQLYCTYTHTCCDSVCMDNCQTAQAITFDSAKVSDEVEWSRTTPFSVLSLCFCKAIGVFTWRYYASCKGPNLMSSPADLVIE